jgi:hypothetical protein
MTIPKHRRHESPAFEVRRAAAQALWVAGYAASAYDDGLPYSATAIHAAAGHLLELILAVVSHLTEEEADWVEPSVTELEEELARFGTRQHSHPTYVN